MRFMFGKDFNSMSDDEKIAALEHSGHIVPDKKPDTPEKPEVPPATPPAQPAVPADAKKDTPPADSKPADSTPPATPAVPATDPANDKKVNADPQNPSREQKPRPLKYIPLDKYQAEKSEWEKTKTDLEAAEAKLKALSENPVATPAQAGQSDAALTKFAEKYGYEVADVKELAAAIAQGNQIPKDVITMLEEQKRQKLLVEETAHFEKEFGEHLPALQKQYPNLTPEQIQAVKARLNEIGHTKEFHDKSLDYVIFKNAQALEEIVKPAPAGDPAPEPRRTVESARMGNHGPTGFTAKDFKDRKTFDEFHDMDPAVRSKIIEDMDPKTYQNFITWAGQESDGGVVVNRNGQTIRLK